MEIKNQKTLLTVDSDTKINLDVLSRYCKTNINNYLCNSLEILEKKINDPNFNFFEQIQKNLYDNFGSYEDIETIIMQMVASQAFSMFMPKVSIEISNEVNEKINTIRNKINKDSQYKYKCLSDEEQWENPLYISAINTAIIQIANDIYINEISYGELQNFLDEIVDYM